MAEVGVARVTEPMTPNTTIENTSSGLKRRADDEDLKSKGKVDNGLNAEKRPKVDAPSAPTPLVELKGRKLVYKQDAAPKTAPSRKRMLLFETLLVDAEEETRKITEIPEENWDVIVLAGHESTARTGALLVKQIKTALKVDDDKDLLPNETVAALIPKLFIQEEYGFLPTDFAPYTSTAKLPASLQIRCWEAKQPQTYFTPEQYEVIKSRRAERLRVREECLRILSDLDDIEKLELIKGEKGKKEVEVKKDNDVKMEVENSTPKKIEASPRVQSTRKSREGTANTADSRRSMSPGKKGKMTPEEEEAARIRREEKEARRAQRVERKAAQEREEEKKQAAKAKQQAAMSMFFRSKPASSPLVSRETTAGPSTVRQDSPLKMTDYQRAFRPVQSRAHVKWAEINRWVKPRAGSQSPSDGERKSVPGESAESGDAGDALNVEGWQKTDFLRDHLRKHRLRSSGLSRLPDGLKTAPPDGPVSEVMVEYQEASDPRKVLARLQNRRKFPWKVLAFDQQVRPPYCGTFTKKSAAVGPRTPFAQDPMFDYSYDSGDDWQDDEGGEDVDDFGETQEPDEEDAEDDSEGEFDDWLDDSEDVPYAPMDGDDDTLPLQGPTIEQAKLPMKVVKKSQVPRKVVKVTPTWRGPMWESQLGQGSDGMEGFRLQLLNDTPDIIDPFSYVSKDADQAYKPTFTTMTIGTNLSVKCLLATEGFTGTTVTETTGPPTTEDAAVMPIPTKAKPAGPKIAFPTSHLPELLRLIEGNTKIRSDLVSQLRDHFDTVTSKAAIEAKIKEVAFREGKSKISQWKVKPEAWAACKTHSSETDLTSPRGVRLDSSSF